MSTMTVYCFTKLIFLIFSFVLYTYNLTKSNFYYYRYDFFLVSQHVRQGTVTPTHYQIIEDTLKLSPDIMQKLTYKLTHMYYNWSVSIQFNNALT